MNEYTLLCQIINDKFLVKDQHSLKETQGNELPSQIVKISAKENMGISKTLFRFDCCKKDFLPFFKDSQKGLRKFCDYVLLAERNDILYVLLIEMKRGSGHQPTAEKQLNASKTFMDYVVASAERLKNDFPSNNNSAFNKDRIMWRKIILEPCKSKKKETKGKKDVDVRQEFILYKSAGLLYLPSLM